MTDFTDESVKALLDECDNPDCLTCEYARALLDARAELALTPADATAALDRMLAEALMEAAKVAGDAAVEVLLRNEPSASPLKIQLTRQAVANPIRALITAAEGTEGATDA